MVKQMPPLAGQGKHEKQPRTMIIVIILLAAGIFVLAFPMISQWFYGENVKKLDTAFVERMEQLPPTERDELYLKMVAYNKALYESGQNELRDAFSYEQVDFSLKEFGFDEEMIGYIEIPALEVELPIYLGANRENLNRGAAHLSKTSLPIGGNNTNAVIAAHRGMGAKHMFRYIERLEKGDLIFITNYRETLVYKVAETAIIKPHEIDKILIQPGKDMVTLISCNPYRYNYERYVVYAQRVKNPNTDYPDPGQASA